MASILYETYGIKKYSIMSTKAKFILTYLGGVVTGIIFVFVLGVIVNASQGKGSVQRDVVLFEKPQQTIGASEIEVFQVLPDGSALATVQYSDNGNNDNVGMVVMLLAKDGVSYFDSQSIKIPSGKCMKQIGTYKYMSRQEMEKTVPVVEIFDK